MKHWEEAGILTDLLDRHVRQLLGVRDRTIYWYLSAFLNLIDSEPALVSFVVEYLEDLGRTTAEQPAQVAAIVEELAAVYAEHDAVLLALKPQVDETRWEHHEFEQFDQRLRGVREQPQVEAAQRVVETLWQWIGFGRDPVTQEWQVPALESANVQIANLRNRVKQALFARQRMAETHPGAAYIGLRTLADSLEQAASGDLLADELANRHAEEIRQRVADAEMFGEPLDKPLQPDVARIHRQSQTLHLALVTSLAMGRSRWATVRRFGARCETFDREQIVGKLAAAARGRGTKRATPEAILTLALARYLFDAGFNPLVDAAACGLRPDVLDATSEPAVYVEAKQYANVGPSIKNKLRRDVAQTLNTWARLSNRWQTPEAFLVVFRRSGRHIEIENPAVRAGPGWLYVICIDLADSRHSGSRTPGKERVDVAELLTEVA